jgi:hypothetical protein
VLAEASVDAVKKATLVSILLVAGMLCGAALAVVPAVQPSSRHVRAKGCDPRALRAPVIKTTVDRLRRLLPARGRAAKASPRVFQVRANLARMSSAGGKTELVLSDPAKPAVTLVADFPHTGCGKSTPLSKRLRRARAALGAACGTTPQRASVRLHGQAALTGVAEAKRGAEGKSVRLSPVLGFRATSCAQVAAAAGPPAPATPVAAASAASTEPPPAPRPEPAPGSDCTLTLSSGAIEAVANRSADSTICLKTAIYQEPGDALIVIRKDNVRVQAVPGAYPIVCGRFVLRGEGDQVAPDVHADPACAPYFNEDSPWNVAASQYPPSVPVPASWLKDFDGANGATPLEITRSWTHGKAIFRASPGDSVTATFRIADASQCMNDPKGCASWQPKDPAHFVPDETSPVPDRIPIPAGVRCPGLPLVDDGHDRALTVISADGQTAWDFWHCTHAATPQEPWYTAAVAAKWQLDPDDPGSLGYQSEPSNSARASGTPIVSTTVTPLEAVRGIRHAIGLTVVNVAAGYVNPPASHSDGCLDACSHLHYGMLFVLDPSFKPAVRFLTQGELNVIDALKRYGAYIVDQSTVFEMDGSPNEPTNPMLSDFLWNWANVSLLARVGIKPSDFRYVPTPGSPPATP